MLFSVEKVPGEAIVCTTFDDGVRPVDVEDAFLLNLQLSQTVQGDVFRVVDLRQAKTRYCMIADTLRCLAKAISQQVRTHMRYVFIGDETMQSYFCLEGLPFCTDMQMALQYAYSESHPLFD